MVGLSSASLGVFLFASSNSASDIPEEFLMIARATRLRSRRRGGGGAGGARVGAGWGGGWLGGAAGGSGGGRSRRGSRRGGGPAAGGAGPPPGRGIGALRPVKPPWPGADTRQAQADVNVRTRR